MDKQKNAQVLTLNGSNGASAQNGGAYGLTGSEITGSKSTETASHVRQILVPVPVFTRETAFAHGRDVALRAGDAEVKAQTVASLTEYCRAMAREMKRGLFDPANNAHDKLRQEEYEALVEERRVARHALSLADGRTRDAKQSASAASPLLRKDAARWAVGAAAAGLLALGFAPTIHDLFFDELNLLAGWYWSGIASLVLGGCMAGLLLWLDSYSDEDDRLLSRKGLWAGVGIAFAFCAARWRDADGTGAVLFSLALFVYEAAVVLLVETVLASMRKAKRLREEGAAQSARLASEAAAHEEHGETLRRRIAELDDKIEAFINYVEQRDGAEKYTGEIEQGLVSAALDGYNAGIAANLGKILGT